MRKLRHGYTTGACAAAAAKGAALMLRDRKPVREVEITLPAGERVRFKLHGQELCGSRASCFVVKDAGDDPDITNGAEIHAAVSFGEGASRPAGSLVPEQGIVIEGGQGIGRITKPGLALPVGEWAINPVPRRMIREALEEIFVLPPVSLRCRISIPNGEELAQRTLNQRLGILGGLSILGTTGIVRPVSAKAWTDTIDAAIDVALASGAESVVLSTGRTSELAAQQFLKEATGSKVREEAFVMMGDHVGHAARSCSSKGVRQIVLAAQFAKLLKIACGHQQTHVSSSRLDLGKLAEWAGAELGDLRLDVLIGTANSARQVLEGAGDLQDRLVAVVAERAAACAQRLAGNCTVKVLLAGYHGEVLYFA